VGNYDDYIKALIRQFWDYAEAELIVSRGLLDSDERNPRRPPVFQKWNASKNVLISPDADEESTKAILSTLAANERHQHFASMRSSQALAQSVFGNLAVEGKLGLLNGLNSDEKLPAFGRGLGQASMQLEHSVRHLGEPRPTSVDVWFESECRIAVECKLTEPEFGTCSRPKLKAGIDQNFRQDYCDGSYTRQGVRQSRCSLSEIGVKYWDYIPEIFHWRNDKDVMPCVLRNTYQLVRNVLAASVTVDGRVESSHVHALVIYDANNPSFRDGGVAAKQLAVARQALSVPSMLRSCSWQSLVAHVESSGEMLWLTGQLRAKYGF
jgi:hypothetical protein